MAALTNTQISVTYVGLLKTSASTVLSSTAQQMTDGAGNNSILYLSTAEVGIGGSPTAGKELDVTGNVLITGDLQVDNININGNTISATSGVVTLSDGTIATTQSANDNSTKVATTEYVDTEAGNYLPLAGGTMSGNIAMGGNNISGGGTFTATTFSGELSGTISSTTTATTQTQGDNSTKVATTAYVDSAIGDNDTLAEILANGNTTGGTDISVSAGDDITFTDSSKAIFGTGSDLKILHDGTDSFINSDGSGDLYIQQFNNDKDIIFKSDDGSGGVATYISIDGSDVITKIHKQFRYLDNVKATFGNGDDLDLIHNGTDSYIQNRTGNLEIINYSDDKDILFRSDDGSGGTALYFQIDGSAELNKFIKDSKHPDSIKAIFGDSNDLQIYHDGSNSYINESGNGDLLIRGINVQISNTSNVKMFRGVSAGEAILYYNNSKKFETTSGGIQVTGGINTSDGFINVGNGQNNAENYLQLGNSRTGDGFAYVDFIGDTTYSDFGLRLIRGNSGANTTTDIIHRGTGNFNITTNEAANLRFQTGNTNALTLDSSQNATFAGNVEVNGTLIDLDSSTNATVAIDRGATSNDAIVSWRNAGSEFFKAGLDDTDSNLWSLLHTCGSGLYFEGNSMNFGIGTSTPQKTLHIEGDGGASESQLLITGASDTVGHTAGILLRAEAGEGDSSLRAKGAIFFERTAANGLGKFHICNNNSNNNDAATLSDAKLTVEGDGSTRFNVDSSSASAIDIEYVSSTRTIRALETGGGNARPLQIIAQNHSFKNDSGTLQFLSNTFNTSYVADGLYGATATPSFIKTSAGEKFLLGYRDNGSGLYASAYGFTTTSIDGLSNTAEQDVIVLKNTDLSAEVFAVSNLGRGYFRTDLGIGTTTIRQRLHQHVSDSGANYHAFTNSTTGTGAVDGLVIGISADEDALIWNHENENILFGTNNTERMRIDSSGNVIVGGTAVDTAGSFSIKNNGVVRGVLSSGTVDDTLINAISGVSNGFQITNDASNNQNYKFHSNGGNLSLIINSSGNVGIGEPSPASDLVVRSDSSGGRGGEISIINYASNAVGNEAALNFGLENSTYAGDDGNAQIKAIISGSSAETDMVFTNWSGSAFTERMRINSDGDVLMNCTSVPSGSGGGAAFETSGTLMRLKQSAPSTTSTKVQLYYNANGEVGSIATSGSATAFNTSSDYRLKENVVEMTGALDRVNQLKPSRFNFIADADTTVDGFLAHEVQDIVPEAITGEKDATYQHLVTEAVEAQDAVEWTDKPTLDNTKAEIQAWLDENNIEWQSADTKQELLDRIPEYQQEAVEAQDAVYETRPEYQAIDQSKLVPLLVGAIKELKARIEVLENS